MSFSDRAYKADMGQKQTEEKIAQQNQPRRGRFKLLLPLVVLAALATVALAGWKEVFGKYLEAIAPEIRALEMPHGVGIAPVVLRFELKDEGAGLDEVVVRTRQRGMAREVLRRPLQGQARARVDVEFPGEKSGLQEGLAEIEVKVFDRSFWSNSAEKIFTIRIDYRRPRLEVLTSQHNARQGGSQLILYRAMDENLALSGVKVGGQTFLGYPARGLDRELEDTAMFAAIYAHDLRTAGDRGVPRLFAEDQVGNTATRGFYNKAQPRRLRQVQVKVTERFLQDAVLPLAERNMHKLEVKAPQTEVLRDLLEERSEEEALIDKFRLVNTQLRELNDYEVTALLKGTRFERYWNQVFLMPNGSVQHAYGDQISFLWESRVIGQVLQAGYEFLLPGSNREVLAANDGIVVFSENIGVYGRCLGLDHGLGLTSLYGHLEQVFVRKGEVVTRGQRIGLAGSTGFSRGPNLYFEMRVNGIPVDPNEWWESGWFYGHITAKINDIKKILGIPVYRPLGN